MRPIGYRLPFAGALLIVLLNTWLAFRSVLVLIDSQQWQNHTLQVISEAEGLFTQIRTAEGAARGYILTPDPSFERLYRDASVNIFRRIDRLSQLTIDNKLQQDRIPALRDRTSIRLAQLETGVQIRRTNPSKNLTAEELQAISADAISKPLAIQQVINEIEGEERRLLQQRTERAASAQRSAVLTLGLASGLDLFFIILAFVLLERESRSRQQIARQSDEIRALNTDLEKRVQERTLELESSNQELEAFSYSVSHDLRAPLRTIDGFSLALYEDFAEKLDDEGRDYINRVRAGVQRMGQLIDALLQLSRVTRSEFVTERTDLADLARSISIELQTNDPHRKVRFLIPSTPVLASADPRLLRVALENLMGNAWKFTSKTEDARIEFGAMRKEGESVFFIRDNGAGFDMYYVDRLFTAFQRLHGDRDFKGSGIGLATTLRIIRRHKGRIWAEGKENEGATFYFTLGA